MINIDALKFIRRTFWLYLFISIILGFFFQENPHVRDAIRIAIAIIGTFFVFSWAHYDSKAIGKPLSPLFKIGFLALPFLFVPIYIFKTRGFSRGFLTILMLVLKVIGVLVLASLIFTGIQMHSFRLASV